MKKPVENEKAKQSTNRDRVYFGIECTDKET